jgi:hypothetical protein
LIVKGKSKQFLYWLLGFQEVEVLRISEQLVHEGGKVISSTVLPPLTPGDTRGTDFLEKESTPVSKSDWKD